MVIVLFSKGMERVVHTCFYNVRFNINVDKKVKDLLELYPDAMYWEIFSEDEYKTKFT